MEITILNQIIIGFIQGLFEWLPISSSAFISLFATNFLGINNLESLIQLALFFHLGTFLSALVYFRKDVKKLLNSAINYKKSKDKKLLNFLFISFLVTSILGFLILRLISNFSDTFTLPGKVINLFVAGLLIMTAIIGFSSKKRGLKLSKDLKMKDSLLLGVAQALAVLPGISRSGITTSTFLLRKFDDTTALKLSFLMSLPVVLFGNIILNFSEFSLNSIPIFGLISSFTFGILTIHGLIKISKRINFNYFVLIFGLILIIASIFF